MPEIRCCTPRILTPAQHAAHHLRLNPPGVQAAVMRTDSKWPLGHVLTIEFRGGRRADRQAFLAAGSVWARYANIGFMEVSANAEIRVSFDLSLGSWAYVGTQALSVASDEPTANMGWPDDPGRDLHEWGHILGLEHEDMRRDSGLKWNIPAVLAYFGGPPNNWSEQEVYDQVLNTLDPSTETASGPFDSHSIMAYSIPAELLLDPSQAVPQNDTLSAGDIALIQRMYPR